MSSLALGALFVTVFGAMSFLQASEAQMLFASCFHTFGHRQFLELETPFDGMTSNVAEQAWQFLRLLSRGGRR